MFGFLFFLEIQREDSKIKAGALMLSSIRQIILTICKSDFSEDSHFILSIF